MKQGSERHARRGKISGKFRGHGVLVKSVVFGAFRDTFGGSGRGAGHPGFASRLDETEIGPSNTNIDPSPYGPSKTVYLSYKAMLLRVRKNIRALAMKDLYRMLVNLVVILYLSNRFNIKS